MHRSTADWLHIQGRLSRSTHVLVLQMRVNSAYELIMNCKIRFWNALTSLFFFGINVLFHYL